MEKMNEMQVANEGAQMLVRMLFESQKQMFPEAREMSEEEFARKYLGKYMLGRLESIYGKDFTEQAKDYVADAVAKFGGYESYINVLKIECKKLQSFVDGK